MINELNENSICNHTHCTQIARKSVIASSIL